MRRLASLRWPSYRHPGLQGGGTSLSPLSIGSGAAVRQSLATPFEERCPMLFYLPIALTALATTLYHIAQKSIVPGVHPMVSLVITYATSLVACLAVVPFAPGGARFLRSRKELNWATYVVGLWMVGGGLRVLLAYRAGWRISLASVVANVPTALLLVLIGVLGYREHLAARHVVGLLMCLAGPALAARP